MLRPLSLVAAFLLGLVTFLPESAIAQAITADIDVNRTSGVAPLSVFFDASGTGYSDSGVDPFLDLDYVWDFGDTNAGSWATSGHSKNRAVGAVASHVFDTPGSYTVTLAVSDGDGATVSRSVSIRVDDPDVVFSGSNTKCFSKTSDFSGCPSGADQIQTSSWNTIGSAASSGKRVLLRAGQTWTTGSRVTQSSAGPGIIGAFGAGEKPIVDLSSTLLRFDGADDWRVMDLDLRGVAANNVVEFECSTGPSRKILFYQLSIRQEGALGGKVTSGIKAHHSKCDYYGHAAVQDSISVVGSDVFDIDTNNVHLNVTHLVVMGSKIHDSEAGHAMRTGWSVPGVIQHNDFHTAYANGHLLKLHGASTVGDMAFNGEWQEHVIVSDNHFHNPQGVFNVEVAPQSARTPNNDENLRKIIVERNFFEMNDGHSGAAVLFAAQDSVIRNNIMNLTGAGWIFGALLVRSQGTQSPTNVQVYNNTCYVASLTVADETVPCVRLGGGSSGAKVMNNLHYPVGVPTASVVEQEGSESSTVIQGNVKASSNPFVRSSPSIPADFMLKSGSSAVDSAIPIAGNHLDFFGASRPADGTGNGSAAPDVGALELNGVMTDPPVPTEPPGATPDSPDMLVPLVSD